MTFLDWYCLPCCRFLEALLIATACSWYLFCQAWQPWACSLAYVQRACCHTGASRWNGVPSQPALLMWPCVSAARPSVHLGPLTLCFAADNCWICWLNFAYFVQVSGCWRIFCHRHPKSSPSQLLDFFWNIEKTQTTHLCLLLTKINPHAKQQVTSQTSWTLSPSFPNAEWTNCTYMTHTATCYTPTHCTIFHCTQF